MESESIGKEVNRKQLKLHNNEVQKEDAPLRNNWARRSRC